MERKLKLAQQFDADNSVVGKPPVYRYVVKQIKNATSPRIGEHLTEARVQELTQYFDITID